MQKKVLIRLIFVVLVVFTCFYYFVAFQKYLRSTSDPLESLPATTEEMFQVNDGNEFLKFLDNDSLPLYSELYSNWKLWMGWKQDNERVRDLMSEQRAYWVHLNGMNWFLFLPIPDRWNEEQIDLLVAGIPNLKQWESCLVWGKNAFSTDGWELMPAEARASWKELVSKSDKSASFTYLGMRGQSRIVLDYNEGQWIGLMEDNEWLSESQPIQMKDSIMGNAQSTFWHSANSELILKNENIKKRVFSLDTLCQCNVLDSWVGWQDDEWKYQTYDGEHWVASQKYIRNPWLMMSSFLRDTLSKVVIPKHPEWMPLYGDFITPAEVKYMSKKGGRIYLSDDSLSLCTAIKDTAHLFWHSDFTGFSENHFMVFYGQFSDFPGLKRLKCEELFGSGKVKLDVLKNNENWLVRIAIITK